MAGRPQFRVKDLFGGTHTFEPSRAKPLLNVNKQGLLNVIMHTHTHNRALQEQVCVDFRMNVCDICIVCMVIRRRCGLRASAS